MPKTLVEKTPLEISEKLPPPLSRRNFILLTVAATACPWSIGNALAAAAPTIIDAGPLTDYAADGIYAAFRDQGFFIVSKGGQLTALSSRCTHRGGKLNPQPDKTFLCPRHDAKFDATGKVIKGPAKKDLPVFATSNSEAKHVLVSVPVV